MGNNDLFSDFSTISKQEWIDKATVDLKGASFDEKLIWSAEEGLEIMPFYTKEDLDRLAHLESAQNSTFDSENAHLGARYWQFRQVIQVENEKVANQEILQILNLGAEAIALDLSKLNEKTNFELLLNEVLFPYCDISFHLSENHFSFFQGLESYLQSRGFSPKDLRGTMPVTLEAFEEASSLIKGSKIYPNFRTVVVSHEATGNSAEKIADLLHQTVNNIDQLIDDSLEATEVFAKLEFVYQLSNNYFFEIAALRALRVILCGVAKQYGLTHPEAKQFHIQAQTSTVVNETTQQHPEWNMLSNTNQAMAAIIGGCSSLVVTPHNQGISEVEDFSKRIARNVSNILREEAYFDKVADPAAGSYYIETLTQQIAEKAWELFQQKLNN